MNTIQIVSVSFTLSRVDEGGKEMLASHSNLEVIAKHFESATCPEDIFGNLAGGVPEKLAALKWMQRDLTRTCHPDMALSQDKALATQLFQSLGDWECIARLKIEVGTYGDFKPYVAPAPPYAPVELIVRGKAIKLTGLLAEGVFSSVHSAEYDGDSSRAIFVKYARDPQDNDLLEREYLVLRTLQLPDDDLRFEEFFEKQRVYVPTPVASFSILDEDKAKHRANALAVPLGRCFTAEELLTDKFPGGIEPKHVWWIFRRLLLTAWMAHLKGYVHGGITPDHVLIFPDAHGVVLLDWTCAAKIGEEHIPAINTAYKEFYPPETVGREMAAPSSDIFMAAATAIHMLGGDPARWRVPASVPETLAQSLLSCLDPIASRRPQDAELFHNEFGALLGKRIYAEMIVP